MCAKRVKFEVSVHRRARRERRDDKTINHRINWRAGGVDKVNSGQWTGISGQRAFEH